MLNCVHTDCASHLAKFFSKVPPLLGFADVEKRCLLPYTSTAAIRLLICDTRSSTFSERMLRLGNAAAKKKVCPARPQRSNCSPSFQALTIYIPRLSRLKECPRRLQLARLRPRQQAQPPVQPNTRHVFSAHLTLQQPSQDSSPFFSSLTFERPSSQTFPQDTSPSCSSFIFEQPTL